MDPERVKRLRRTGIALIAVIYTIAIGVLFLGPEWMRWPLIGLVVLLPLVGVGLPTNKYGDAGIVVAFIFAAISVVTIAAYVLVFGSATARLGLAGIVAVAVSLGLIYCIAIWVREGGYHWRSRVMIICIFLAVAALASGIIFGNPLIRWSATGIAAAFLLSIFNLRGASREQRWIPENNDARGWRMESRSEGPRWAAGKISANGNLYALDAILASAQHALDLFIRYDAHEDRWHGYPTDIIRAVAALDNLGFISPEFTQDLRDLIQEGPFKAPSENKLRREELLSALLDEITYTRSRVEAHNLGAHNAALGRGASV